MMNIQPIHTDADLERAFARMEQLWTAEEGSEEADELEVLSILIEKYEDEHYPIGPSDPIEAIKFRMEQLGLTNQDLEPYIGSSGRVSEVLNRKRGLSLNMIRRLHHGLRIPYESLMSDAAAEPERSNCPSTGSRIRQQAGSHGNLNYEAPVGDARAALRLAANYFPCRWQFACKQASHSGSVA